MTFVEFYRNVFLLKENPDYATFNIGNDEIEKSYRQDFYTFSVLGDCIFYSNTMYHAQLNNTVKNYLINNSDEQVLSNNNVYKIGKVSKQFKDYYLKEMQTAEFVSRDLSLDIFPEVLLGRAWKEKIHNDQTDDFCDVFLVSIWNDSKYLTLEDLSLIKKLANEKGVSDENHILFELEKETKSLNELSKRETALSGKSASADKTGMLPVHNLMPNLKKAALLSAGAKPKIPINLALKMKRDER